MRPRIYLSGPLTLGGTASVWQQHENVRFATEFAHCLMRAGYAVFNPAPTILGEQHVGDRLCHQLWIENDLPWVAASDALYRLPGESTGADMEVDFAGLSGVPVFRDVPKMDAHFRALGRIP